MEKLFRLGEREKGPSMSRQKLEWWLQRTSVNQLRWTEADTHTASLSPPR